MYIFPLLSDIPCSFSPCNDRSSKLDHISSRCFDSRNLSCMRCSIHPILNRRSQKSLKSLSIAWQRMQGCHPSSLSSFLFFPKYIFICVSGRIVSPARELIPKQTSPGPFLKASRGITVPPNAFSKDSLSSEEVVRNPFTALPFNRSSHSLRPSSGSPKLTQPESTNSCRNLAASALLFSFFSLRLNSFPLSFCFW
jgi:hypothetical protein